MRQPGEIDRKKDWAADAPPPPQVTPLADIRGKPMRDYSSAEDAYEAALELDTLDGYEQFLAIYPHSRFAKRIAAMLAVRREAISWRRCVLTDTPQAYWSYLRRYPDGPHAGDAHRRLVQLAAELEPPPTFDMIDFGVPPPPPDELVFVDRPIIIFAGPEFAPPPPPPVFFLPPRPREFVVLAPPPRPQERFFLPTPTRAAVPRYIKPPATVALRPVAPGSPTAPGGRPMSVSLPAAVRSQGKPGAPGVRPGAGPGAVPAPLPTSPRLRQGTPGGPTPLPPSTAFGKPAPLPHPVSPAPTTIKPAPVPPHPTGPVPSAIKRAPVPPPPHPGPVPTVVKPAPSPPHPGPAPAVVRPPAPPLQPPTPAAVKPPPAKPPAKPACPPGKRPTPEGCK